jgi:hypothetical protein
LDVPYAHAGDGSDVDDAPPLVAHHQARCPLAAQEGTVDVDGHRRGEVVVRELQERVDLRDARRVDEHVAAAVPLLDGREGAVYRRGVADIDGLGLGRGTAGTQLGGRLLGGRLVAVGHDDDDDGYTLLYLG